MRTSLEIALQRAEELQPIPLITDPMGRGWSQPDRREIVIDDTSALMTRRVFNQLHEYSASFPSGVYPGKMWKRHDGGFDRQFRARGGKPTWKLVWFGNHPDPKLVSNNFRAILIIEDGSPVNPCSCCRAPEPLLVGREEPDEATAPTEAK